MNSNSPYSKVTIGGEISEETHELRKIVIVHWRTGERWTEEEWVLKGTPEYKIPARSGFNFDPAEIAKVQAWADKIREDLSK